MQFTSAAAILFVIAGDKLFLSPSWFFGRAAVASKAFYLQRFVTLTALDYYFKDYFKP